MRWYVYALNGNTPKIILDHNTTNQIAWIDGDAYEPNEACGEWDFGYAVCNDQGAKSLVEQLTADTKEQGWKVEADIITLEEVANLIPYYQNLSDTEKELFLNPTEENTAVIDRYYDYATGEFFEEVCSKRENFTICESGDINSKVELFTSQTNSPMLPGYMFMDMLLACPAGNDCPSYGYWTKTADTSNFQEAWVVWAENNQAYVYSTNVDHFFSFSLRPVITLSK